MQAMGGVTREMAVVLLLALSAALLFGSVHGAVAAPKRSPVHHAPTPKVQPPAAPPVFAPAPEPAPLWPFCEGVDIVYVTTFTEKIYPYLNDTPWLQPYKFESQVTLTNMGYSTVEAWAMWIKFQYHEVSILVLLGKSSTIWMCFAVEHKPLRICIVLDQKISRPNFGLSRLHR
jgi:hypothetical protein